MEFAGISGEIDTQQRPLIGRGIHFLKGQTKDVIIIESGRAGLTILCFVSFFDSLY